MKVVEADWAEMLPILAENHAIWGAGLSPQLYRSYLTQQFYKPWFRQNCHYYVLQDKTGKTAAGLKLYQFCLTENGKQKSIAGIGAVYTLRAFRGMGYANKLLKQVLSMCRQNKVSGVLLFSDIGAEFYESLDFVQLPALNYSLKIEGATATPILASAIPSTTTSSISKNSSNNPASNSSASTSNSSTFLDSEQLDLLFRIYNRSKAQRKSHIERSIQHWQFKLWREEFLQAHSTLNWPGLRVMISPGNEAYLLYEYNDQTLRVLELIGKEPACLQLWSQVLEIAKNQGASRIRGWQAGLPQEIATPKHFTRDWGHPMIHIFEKDLLLPKLDYFPLLELDHF